MLQSRTGVIAIPVIVLLLLSFSATATTSDSQLSLLYQQVVPGGYYVWYPIYTAAASNWITISAASNVSISTALMSSSQFSSFNSSSTTEISDSLYLQNGTSVQHSLQVSMGDFYLVFFVPQGSANVSYNYVVDPNSPYQYGPLPSPEPTGIASFGLFNDSGMVTPYSVESSEVVGVADISSMQAYNGTSSSVNASMTDAGIQLNSILVVNETGGSQQVYWVQNTPTFDTGASLIAYGDNVWNFSVSGFLSNSTITSPVGYASTYVQYGVTQYYYSYEASNSTYAMPLRVALLINETATPGQGVLVQFGTQIFGSGTEAATPADWFDNVTIHDPTVQTAYFSVNGNATTPIGTYYDTEFVFGGEDNGEATSFTSLGATLGLFYDNASSGLLTSFPSYYSFGQDTAESADNLQVSFSGDGFVQVSVGTPNYAYLGTSSGSYTLTQAAGGSSSSSSSSSTSTSSATSQSASPTSSSYSTSSSSSSSTSSTSSSIPLSYLVLVAATASIILSGAVWVRVRRTASPGPPGTR